MPSHRASAFMNSWFLRLTCLILFASSALAQLDPEGSLDVRLMARLESASHSLAGEAWSARLVVQNLTTSAGPAFDLGFALTLPDSCSLTSVPAGYAQVHEATAAGTRYLAFESRHVLAVGESRTLALTIDPGLTSPPGTSIAIQGLAYADDSPFERGAPPSFAPPGTPHGGVEASFPSLALAAAMPPAADDPDLDFPTSLVNVDPLRWSSVTTQLTAVETRVRHLVADGERPVGRQTHSFLTEIRVDVNRVVGVTDIHLQNLMDSRREILGFGNRIAPFGSTRTVHADVPQAGWVTLEWTDLDLAAGGFVIMRFESGITPFEVAAATNPQTGHPGSSISLGTTVVADGGAVVGAGVRTTDELRVLAASVNGTPLPASALPPVTSDSTEAEYLAVQVSSSRSSIRRGDEVTFTSSIQVSDELAIHAATGPFEIRQVIPDGLRLRSLAHVSISSGLAHGISPTALTTDSMTGDQTLVLGMPSGGTLQAGQTVTMTVRALVDGLFEGSGPVDLTAGLVLRSTVLVTGTIGSSSTLPPGLIGTATADDAVVSVRVGDPTFSKRLVSVLRSDGTLYDGTSATGSFSTQTDAVHPGDRLRFALVLDALGVHVPGVLLQDWLPLIVGPSSQVAAIELNADPSLVDISGALLRGTDFDGDGVADASWPGWPSTLLPGVGGGPSVLSNNGLAFAVGDMVPDSRCVVLLDVLVSTSAPSPLPSDGLFPTRNAGAMTWEDLSGSIAGTLHEEVDFFVGVPRMTLTHRVTSSTAVDAGDLVVYEAVLENVGVQPAYLDAIELTLPSEVVVQTSSVEVRGADGILIPVLVSTTPDGLLLETTTPLSALHPWSVPSSGPQGRLTVSWSGTIAAATAARATLDSAVAVDYWSGAQAPVEHRFESLRADASIRTTTFDLRNDIVASSSSETTGTNIAIGEVITYEVRVDIPEGTHPDLTLELRLPEEIELLNTAPFGQDPGLSLNPQSPAAPVLQDAVGSDGLLDRATYSLGEVSSTVSSARTIRSMWFRLDARLLDHPRNRSGHRPRMLAVLRREGASMRSRGRRCTVVVPELEIVKSTDRQDIDSGDSLTYTIRFQHTSGSRAPAFDLRFEDVVPSEFQITGPATTRVSPGSGIVAQLVGTGTAADPYAVTCSELGMGEWVEMTFDVQVIAVLSANQIIRNTATGRYTTLPGRAIGERWLFPSTSHDLRARGFGVSDSLIATSWTATPQQTLSVGEGMTIQVVVDVPEGVTPNVRLEHRLPAGLASETTVTVSAAPILGIASGTYTVTQTSARAIDIDFGTITNPDRDDSVAERILVTFSSRVLNVSENQRGTVHRVGHTLRHDDGTSTSDGVSLSVAMGRLGGSLTTQDRYGRAGDLVTFELKVHDRGSAWDQPDSEASIVLPPALAYVGAETFTGAVPAVDLALASSGIVTYRWSSFPAAHDLANPVIIRFTCRLTAQHTGALVEIPFAVRWTSLPANLVAGPSHPPEWGRRTGDPATFGGALNDLEFTGRGVFDDGSSFLFAFEDLYEVPTTNDFDYNDVVVRVQTEESYDTSGNLSRIVADLFLEARGAASDHQVWFRTGIVGPVTGQVEVFNQAGTLIQGQPLSLASGSEDVLVFPSTQSELPPAGGWFPFQTNTGPDQRLDQRTAGGRVRITWNVQDPSRNPEIPDDPNTPFIDEHREALYGAHIRVIGGAADIVVGGAGRAATRGWVSPLTFPSSPLIGVPIAQAITLSRTQKWPTETDSIWDAFQTYPTFVLTGETQGRDWRTRPASRRTWPVWRAAGVLQTPEVIQADSAPVIAGPTHATWTLRPAAVEMPPLQVPLTWFGAARVSPLVGTPLAEDLDGDGDPELLLALLDGSVHALDPAAGTHLQLWSGAGPSFAPLERADVDADGVEELLRGDELGAWSRLLPGVTPNLLEQRVTTHPIKTAAMLGNSHLVLLGGDGALHWRATGTGGSWQSRVVSQRRDVGNHELRLSGVIVNDLNGGGDEWIYGDLEGDLDVQGPTGSLPGWPVRFPSSIVADPALLDIDGDGALDVVAIDRDGMLGAYDRNGQALTGFPVRRSGMGGTCAPAGADLDGDGSVEIVVGGSVARLEVLASDGTLRTGWPRTLSGPAVREPVLADLDGDAELEIVVVTSNGHVHAFDPDGSALFTTPLALGGLVTRSPLVLDLDGDGRSEIVLPMHDGRIALIPTTGRAKPGRTWPRERGGAARTGSPGRR